MIQVLNAVIKFTDESAAIKAVISAKTLLHVTSLTSRKRSPSLTVKTASSFSSAKAYKKDHRGHNEGHMFF